VFDINAQERLANDEKWNGSFAARDEDYGAVILREMTHHFEIEDADMAIRCPGLRIRPSREITDAAGVLLWLKAAGLCPEAREHWLRLGFTIDRMVGDKVGVCRSARIAWLMLGAVKRVLHQLTVAELIEC